MTPFDARARRCRRRRPRQRGAALLVAMIMIFVLSLMGMSAMRGSTLERRMADNSILAREVLQSAESANEIALNDRANLALAYRLHTESLAADAPPTGLELRPVLRTDVDLRTEVTVRYVGEGNAVGASLDASQGANSFDSLHYVVEGRARLPSVRAARDVHQGAYRNAPSS